MISKHYSIFCDECTKTEHLLGQSIKECEDEARNLRWTKEPGKNGKHWYCPGCSKVFRMLFLKPNTGEAE